ncbi:MAG TPA: Gar1/Naf1 family protein [Candidatus Deferrimicrobium sp.]|nr:Gar1/Naf1 family protein [Candidatus Deferrimicrobium sp.]
MRRINTVSHISNQGHLLLRVFQTQIKDLQIGQTVVTKDLTKIGRIFDIFGPINQPYVSIKLNPGIPEPKDLIGEILYSFEEKKSFKKKRN